VKRPHPRIDLPDGNTLLALVAVGASLAFGVAKYLEYAPPGLVEVGQDAITYLAAGERLLAGHELYVLAPGDRVLLMMTPLVSVPFLYPPPLALAWVPLALLGDLGLTIWMVGCAAVLLASVWFVARRSLLASALTIALAPAIGEQLLVANVNALLAGGLLLAWRYRGHAWTGVLLGAMAATKVTPIVMALWLAGQGRTRALGAMLSTIGLAVIVSAIAVGLPALAAYPGVVQGIDPAPVSLDAAVGFRLSTVFLVAGSITSFALRHRPRLSFAVSIVAMTLGSPALYPSSLVLLLPAIYAVPAEVDAILLARLSTRGRAGQRGLDQLSAPPDGRRALETGP
jgi:hypothetical protein